MRRTSTKSTRTGHKERVKSPPAEDTMDSTTKKLTQIKRVYECKTCGLQFDTRQQALTHVCKNKRIRA
jgi:transcription elongation factor Elf1